MSGGRVARSDGSSATRQIDSEDEAPAIRRLEVETVDRFSGGCAFAAHYGNELMDLASSDTSAPASNYLNVIDAHSRRVICTYRPAWADTGRCSGP